MSALRIRTKKVPLTSPNRFEQLPLVSKDSFLGQFIAFQAENAIYPQHRNWLTRYFQTLHVFPDELSDQDLDDLERIYADKGEVLAAIIQFKLPDVYFDFFFPQDQFSAEQRTKIEQQYLTADEKDQGYFYLKEDIDNIDGLLKDKPEIIEKLKYYFWSGTIVNIPADSDMSKRLDLTLLDYMISSNRSEKGHPRINIRLWDHNHPLKMAGEHSLSMRKEGHHFSYGSTTDKGFSTDTGAIQKIDSLATVRSPRGRAIIDPRDNIKPHPEYIKLTGRRIYMDYALGALKKQGIFSVDEMGEIAAVIVRFKMNELSFHRYVEELEKIAGSVERGAGVLEKISVGITELDEFLEIPDEFREIVIQNRFGLFPMYFSQAQIDKIHERTSVNGQKGFKQLKASEAAEFLKLTSVYNLEKLRNEFDLGSLTWWTRNENARVLSDEVLEELAFVPVKETALLQLLSGKTDVETMAAVLLMVGDVLLEKMGRMIADIDVDPDVDKPGIISRSQDELERIIPNQKLGLIGRLMTATSLEQARELDARIREIIARHRDAGTLFNDN